MHRAVLVLSLLASTTALAQMPRPLRPYSESSLPMAFPDKAKRLGHALKTNVVGWKTEGRGYELARDEVGSHCGALLLRSPSWGEAKAGALLHRESALPWRGTLVEARGELRAGNVGQQATLVIIALDAAGAVMASARSEALKGTTSFGWCSVSFKVPETAERLLVGVELVGRGAVFLREFAFDDAELLSAG